MPSSALAPAPSLCASARLTRLKAASRQPGQASFFYWDAHFRNDAVKVLPGEYFVSDEDLLITTTLGSCIAACLWDRERRIGGMNHFMLPDSQGPGDSPRDTERGGLRDVQRDVQRGGRYGSYAMELLINELLKRGATKSNLEAKIFGGGAVIAGMKTLNVGERNTRFVLEYLQTERIPVVSRDVLEVYPRKVCFLPASGKAMVKRLAPTHAETWLAQDRTAAQRAAPMANGGGSVDLF